MNRKLRHQILIHCRQQVSAENSFILFTLISSLKINYVCPNYFDEMMRLKLKQLNFILAFFFIMPSFLYSQVQVSEYRAKAFFIEKLISYIEWPNERELNTTQNPFIISILGENYFENYLEEVFKDSPVNKRQVEIRYISRVDDIGTTDILFISSSMKNVLNSIKRYAENKPILTLGDTDGYGSKGVYINFYLENKKIKLKINESKMKDAGFKISYHLLRIAKIVSNSQDDK